MFGSSVLTITDLLLSFKFATQAPLSTDHYVGRQQCCVFWPSLSTLSARVKERRRDVDGEIIWKTGQHFVTVTCAQYQWSFLGHALVRMFVEL